MSLVLRVTSEVPDDVHRAVEGAVQRTNTASIAAIDPIEPGLGTRRFYRLRLSDGTRLIARVERPEDPHKRPPGVGPEPPLEPLRSFLEKHGIPVPASRGRDAAAGIDLLEDLGSETLERVGRGDDPVERRALYAEACGWVPALQRLEAKPAAIPAFGRRLDAALFALKGERFLEWALPHSLGRPPGPAEIEAVRAAFAAIAEESAAAPQRFAHRDFKAANVHVCRPRDAAPRLVLIDLQGAFLAPPEYDLMCLLRDSHVALPEDEVEAHLAAIRPSLPDAPAPDDFQRRFTLLTLTRVGKDLAFYCHAADAGDTRYRSFVPNAVRNLRRAAALAAPWDARYARLAELVAELPEEPCAP